MQSIVCAAVHWDMRFGLGLMTRKDAETCEMAFKSHCRCQWIQHHFRDPLYAICVCHLTAARGTLALALYLSNSLSFSVSSSLSLRLSFYLFLYLYRYRSNAYSLCETTLFLVAAFVHFRVEDNRLEVGDYPPNYHSTSDYFIFGAMKPNMHYFHNFKSQVPPAFVWLSYVIFFGLCFYSAIFSLLYVTIFGGLFDFVAR